MPFSLHPRLAADTVPVGDLPLSRVLMMNNAHFPWLILVPRREGMRELYDLAENDYALAMHEVRETAHALSIVTGAEKMNIAALGNQVPQLHIHVIARFSHDAAWPHPVWRAALSPRPYDPAALMALIAKIQANPRLSNMTKM